MTGKGFSMGYLCYAIVYKNNLPRPAVICADVICMATTEIMATKQEYLYSIW